MSAPNYDYTHAINALKNWPSYQALDYGTTMGANDAPYAAGGRCAHIDPTTGTYLLGVAGIQMPHFLLKGPASFDVANDGGGAWQAGFPAGTMSSLVATGGFELETTEFDTTVTSYTANMVLKSPNYSQGGSSAGLLYNLKNWSGGGGGAMTAYTDTIVGLVSRGTYLNSYKVSVLAFWPDPIYGTQ